jgi:hypothetical protein
LIDSGAEVRLEDFNEAFDIFGDPAIAYFTNFNEEVMVKRGFEDSVRSNKKYLSIWCAISSGINNYYLRGLPEPNSYPNYLLFCALFGKRRNNCARVAKTVLNWGYPVDNIVGPTQFFRGSSGHWPYALESAYFTAFQTLIFQDEDGSEMSEETRLEVAEVLLEYGADLNATFDNFGGPLLYREFELKGRTPIEFCTRFRGPEWTALLLRHGAKLPVDTFTHRQLCSGLGTLGIFGIFVQIYRKALEELEKAGAPIENTEPSEPRTEAGFYSPVATSPDIRYLLASYGASLAAPWALPRTLLPLAKRKTWGVILSRTALGLSNSLKYNPNSQSPI